MITIIIVSYSDTLAPYHSLSLSLFLSLIIDKLNLDLRPWGPYLARNITTNIAEYWNMLKKKKGGIGKSSTATRNYKKTLINHGNPNEHFIKSYKTIENDSSERPQTIVSNTNGTKHWRSRA